MDAHAGSRARVTSMGGLYDAATLRALMCKVRAVCGFADLPSRRIQNARCVFREKEGNEDLPTGMKGIRLFREWFGCKMNIRQSPAKTMCQFAVSEDRTHDLRIVRPTRYQLRYHRHDTSGRIREENKLQLAGTEEDAVNRDSAYGVVKIID